MRRALLFIALALTVLPAEVAFADLPPEPGWTRVAYLYRLDTAVEGRTIVAFPTYNTKDNDSNAVVLEAGKDAGTWQGYQPGLYSLSAADAQNIPKGQDAETAFLAAHAELCLKHVPRVFQVKTTTNISQMTDVIRVAMVGGKCQASLTKTIYKGSGDATGEGGVDAAGKRTPPAPFGSDVPPVGDAGFVAAAATEPNTAPSAAPASSNGVAPPTDGPKTADPHSGCAGCSVAAPSSVPMGIGVAGLLALVLGLRRARRP